MGPITSVNVAAGQGSAGSAQVGGASASNSAAGGAGRVSAQSSSASVGITRINAEVSQMLSGIGGGLQNDKMLQMLIGLIILLALLRAMQGGSDSALGALSQFGQGGSQTHTGELLFSQTTIEIQQVTSNVALGGGEAYASSADTGTTIDTTA